MDSIFFLKEGDRVAFLLHIMESFGCTYICLWQYFQPSNCLMSLDGFYNGENDVARRLFEEYRNLWLIMDNGRIPGLAFKSNLPYMELNYADLQSHASNPVQLQFYQEAGIKTAICMGCSIGEIELGMCSILQVNLEMEIKNLFRDYFSTPAPTPAPARGLPQLLPINDQNRPSSSSSSLRSLSIDSPEYSSLLFNVPSTSYVAEPPRTDAFSEQTTMRLVPPVSATAMPYDQAIQTLSQILGLQFPAIECADAAMTRAYLAVMASPSSSSSSHLQPQDYQIAATQKATAFRRFRSALGPNVVPIATRTRRQNLLKRSIVFFRNLNITRRQEQVQLNRPTSTQVHHMISERKRREKLNESYQRLRSLLPEGTKKDKASVLATTTEYLSSLKGQVEQLSKRNEMLEEQLQLQLQLQPQRTSLETNNQGDPTSSSCGGSDQRLVIEITTNVGESTSESRTLNLQVSIKQECNIMNSVIRLLEFLKRDQNISLESVAADSTREIQSGSVITHITLRLRIEGGEWDESAFQEAVKRIVGDVA